MDVEVRHVHSLAICHAECGGALSRGGQCRVNCMNVRHIAAKVRGSSVEVIMECYSILLSVVVTSL